MKFLVLLFVCLIAVQATRPPELEKFFASAAETVNELQKRDIARSFIVRSKPSRENDLSCLSDTSIEKCDGCSIADSWEAVVDTTECLDTSKEAPCCKCQLYSIVNSLCVGIGYNAVLIHSSSISQMRCLSASLFLLGRTINYLRKGPLL